MGKNVLYANVFEMVLNFIEMDAKNFTLLRTSLPQFKDIFHYVYFFTYSDIYCSTEQRFFNIKSSFYIVHNYKDK